jgi:hypothetical protein
LAAALALSGTRFPSGPSREARHIASSVAIALSGATCSLLHTASAAATPAQRNPPTEVDVSQKKNASHTQNR